MNDNRMTLKDVLVATLDVLGEITVPMKYNETIGLPIAGAMRNISACLEAMERQPEEATEGAEEDGAAADSE